MGAESLSAELKKKLAPLVPAGYDVENLRVLAVTGSVNEVADLRPEEQQVIAEELAKGPAPITDGQPTVMRVVAWMCHEGVNRNRDSFLKEELQLAAAKISTRNPIVMDWNHAAVIGGPGRVIGVWTKADYAFDAKAKDGQGAWGILAEGVMFAWAYPDITNAMLAEQQRNGTVDFSMACIPASVEFGRDENGPYAVLHNPVFFTLSALDVPPADPDAVGVTKEGDNSEGVEAELRKQLTAQGVTIDNMSPWVQTGPDAFSTLAQCTNSGTSASYLCTASKTNDGVQITSNTFDGTIWQAPYVWTTPSIVWPPVVASEQPGLEEKIKKLVAEALKSAAAKSEEVPMDKVEIELSHSLDEKQNQLTVVAKAKISETETVEKTVTIELPTAARLTELETAVAGSNAEYKKLEETLNALQADFDAQEQVLATKVAELDAANALLAGYAAREAAIQRAELLVTRKKELPESYLAAHEALPEERRRQLEDAWADMSDAAWADKVEDLKRAIPNSPKVGSFRARSEREGVLLTGIVDPDSIAGRCQKFTRA